jgi:hypothetical protein
MNLLTKVPQATVFMSCIRELPISNLSKDTDYTN